MKLECLLFIPIFFWGFANSQPIRTSTYAKFDHSVHTNNSDLPIRFPRYINDSLPIDNQSSSWKTYTLPKANNTMRTQISLPVDEDGYVNCDFPDFFPKVKGNEDREKDIESFKINEKCPNTSLTSNNSATCDAALDIEKRKEISGFHVPENTTHLDGRTKILISLANIKV